VEIPSISSKDDQKSRILLLNAVSAYFSYCELRDVQSPKEFYDVFIFFKREFSFWLSYNARLESSLLSAFPRFLLLLLLASLLEFSTFSPSVRRRIPPAASRREHVSPQRKVKSLEASSKLERKTNESESECAIAKWKSISRRFKELEEFPRSWVLLFSTLSPSISSIWEKEKAK